MESKFKIGDLVWLLKYNYYFDCKFVKSVKVEEDKFLYLLTNGIFKQIRDIDGSFICSNYIPTEEVFIPGYINGIRTDYYIPEELLYTEEESSKKYDELHQENSCSTEIACKLASEFLSSSLSKVEKDYYYNNEGNIIECDSLSEAFLTYGYVDSIKTKNWVYTFIHNTLKLHKYTSIKVGDYLYKVCSCGKQKFSKNGC